MIAFLELLHPVGILEDLVKQQPASPLSDKVTNKVYQSNSCKAKLIEVDVKAFGAIWCIVATSIIEEKGRLPHPTRASNTYNPMLPINLFHKCPLERGLALPK